MTLRPAKVSGRNAPVVALDYEIVQEQASALGRLGRALEAALAALVEYDRPHRGDNGRPEPTEPHGYLHRSASGGIDLSLRPPPAADFHDFYANVYLALVNRRSRRGWGRCR